MSLNSKKPTVTIFIYRADANPFLQNWNWMEGHPMGGSEASALHMACALQKFGWNVHVANDPVHLENGSCDIFISTRGWEIFARGIRPGKLNYLWCTDDANQPFVAPLKKSEIANQVYKNSDAILMLSNYQAIRWMQELHLPAEKIFLTSNGIPLERFNSQPESLTERPPWAYYGSTPFRGLDQLLQKWPVIHNNIPGSKLHIFSSMKIYNLEDPQEYKKMYRVARNMPGVHYHGAVGQAVIRDTIRHCRGLAYPCTFPETSCITAMEAMASGCAVVGTAIGALPETAWRNPMALPGPGWLDNWQAEVERILRDKNYYLDLARQNLAIARLMDWNLVAVQWKSRFELDLAKQA
jgi:glycosyltransferase involved in cell wall biosynthesis